MKDALSKRTARSILDGCAEWQLSASRVAAILGCRLLALIFGVVLMPAVALAQAQTPGSTSGAQSGGGWATGGWWIFWIAAAVVAIIAFLAWGKTGGRGHRSPRTDR